MEGQTFTLYTDTLNYLLATHWPTKPNSTHPPYSTTLNIIIHTPMSPISRETSIPEITTHYSLVASDNVPEILKIENGCYEQLSSIPGVSSYPTARLLTPEEIMVIRRQYENSTEVAAVFRKLTYFYAKTKICMRGKAVCILRTLDICGNAKKAGEFSRAACTLVPVLCGALLFLF
ncbi:hypothetical protein P280DRAFT_177881 [Massarina eburnea CBS 473.64]|uniref:Uncharacterized protein n=1 Tax=Massarina eburnea CBS 473.64 TaxID=1395130 RepID=A0A6A6SCV3_9PLEO|nr:hypothetical protein P280DRAFT_177881 [Massarina eburnea CBS 473.64]